MENDYCTGDSDVKAPEGDQGAYTIQMLFHGGHRQDRQKTDAIFPFGLKQTARNEQAPSLHKENRFYFGCSSRKISFDLGSMCGCGGYQRGEAYYAGEGSALVTVRCARSPR